MMVGFMAAVALLLTLGLGGTAFASSYGAGAAHQIEISSNCDGTTCAGLPSGVWLWIDLNANGTGNYSGSDCVHAPGVLLPGTKNGAGALSDSGDVTWTDQNGTLVISGVTLIGNTVPFQVTVPATDGHYVMPTSSVLSGPVPLAGSAEVQVAP